MDGVVHPNVEQAIGRDRIRKALKRYENRPADEHRYGIVRSVNDDGSYEVLLDGDVQTSRCAQYGTALVGDRVLAVTKKDGRNDLIGRLGGEPVDPAIEQRFAELEARLAEAEYDTGWENIYYVASKIKVEARRVGKMVTVNARAYDGYYPAPAGSWSAVTTLPEKFRPDSIKYAALGSDNNNHVGMADIEPDGLVYVISAGSAINSWGFSITYPVD